MPPASFSPQRQLVAPLAPAAAAMQPTVLVPPSAQSAQAQPPRLSHRSLQPALADAQHTGEAAAALQLPTQQQSPLRYSYLGTSPRHAPSASPCNRGAGAACSSARKRLRTPLRFDSATHSPLLEAFKQPVAHLYDAPGRCSSTGGRHGASPPATSAHLPAAHRNRAHATPSHTASKQGAPQSTPTIVRSPWQRLRDAVDQRVAAKSNRSDSEGGEVAGFAAGAMVSGVSGDGDLFTQARDGGERSPVPTPLKQLVTKNLFGT